MAFSALASGGGGARAVAALRESRLSRHLLLIRSIADAWPGEPAERDTSLEVLAGAQERWPERVADLLSAPMVGAWAAWTTRRIRGWVSADTPLSVDLGHLAAVAAVAAARTGLDTDLLVPTRQGNVPLPTLGEALVPLPPFTPARVVARNGSLTVHGGGATVAVPDDPSTDTVSWRGLRRLSAHAYKMPFSVALDDLDPYRGGHHVFPAARLRPAAAEEWQDAFSRCWTLLAEAAPARAAELTLGLRSLVPLAQTQPGTARSATTPDSFGAFGLTLPISPADFGTTLVHEFQHSKLSALLDLVRLCDASAQESYYAPWRTDPRPIGGLLQGAYAFLGVADTWRSLIDWTALREIAVQEFANVREQVHHTIAILACSAELTSAGQRFVAGMRVSTDAMMAVPLPEAAVRRSKDALERNRQAWLLRNGTQTEAKRGAERDGS